jgi:hypothetical protein
MRIWLATSCVAVVVVTNPATVSAQSNGDLAAYIAMNFTPVGAFVPHAPAASPDHGSAFVVRYGNLDLGSSSLHNFAIGGDFPLAAGRFGLTLGGTACDGCKGNVMAGVDYTAILISNQASVGVRPAFGISKPLEGSGTAISVGLSLPIEIAFSGATGPYFIPSITPGLGVGRVSGGGDTESGARPMLGGGLSIAGRRSGVALHVGVQKVFVDGGETTIGLGFSIGGREP